MPPRPARHPWRSGGGEEVDLLLNRDGILYPFEIKLTAPPTNCMVSGIDTPALAPAALDVLVDSLDLILWVTAAQGPDREEEGATLDRLHHPWEAHPERHPPTLLVVVSHIDLRRPRQKWQAPYNLNDPANPKARNIRSHGWAR
ncbi:MAG: hypothetical protein WAT23_14100 [Chromatiaceae bacterium]